MVDGLVCYQCIVLVREPRSYTYSVQSEAEGFTGRHSNRIGATASSAHIASEVVRSQVYDDVSDTVRVYRRVGMAVYLSRESCSWSSFGLFANLSVSHYEFFGSGLVYESK